MFFKVKMKSEQRAPLYEYVIVEARNWIDAEEKAETLPLVFGQPADGTNDGQQVIEHPLNEKWPVLTNGFFEQNA